MTETKKRGPLLTPSLMLFLFTMILANIAGSMYLPLLAIYLKELGADVGQVGLFFTLAAIAPLILQIFGGWLSDVIGRLQAIAVGSVAGVISFVIYVIAPAWGWLLLAGVGDAMARAFVGPSFQAYIAEQADEESLGRVYGMTNTIFNVVGIIGPLLGGAISQFLNFKTMFLVAGLFYSTAAVIRILMARHAQRIETKVREKPSLGHLKSSLLEMGGLLVGGGLVTWLFISDGVTDIAFGFSQQLQPLYMQNLMGITNFQIGLLSAIFSIVTMALLSPAGWLSDKKGERVGLAGGFLLLGLGQAVFLISTNIATFAAAWALFGAGSALINPAYNALIAKVIPERLRGTAFGVFGSTLGLISMPAPYIGGLLWEHFNPRMPFLVPAVALFLLVPFAWAKLRLPPDRPQGQAPETEPVAAS